MTEPRPLSDPELITWGVILERRRQQAARGITLLQQPYPPCPTCGQPVTEAATVEDFGQGQLTVKPCGHDHNFNVGDVYRLSDHIAEMVDLLEQASRRPAGERGWSTADIVREAAARTTPNNPAASSDTADNPLQQRITEAVAPILDEYPEHNRIDEHEHVVSEITAAVLAAAQPELDALDALRAVARGYCPACGRGDAAPTVQDWEQQRQNAAFWLDQHKRARQSASDQRQRAKKAEAAIARVRAALAPFSDRGVIRHCGTNLDIPTASEVIDAVHAALDQPAPDTTATQATEHVYLSTGCFHGDHDYCKAMTGLNGAKRPAECKFCKAPCQCSCHLEQPDA